MLDLMSQWWDEPWKLLFADASVPSKGGFWNHHWPGVMNNCWLSMDESLNTSNTFLMTNTYLMTINDSESNMFSLDQLTSHGGGTQEEAPWRRPPGCGPWIYDSVLGRNMLGLIICLQMWMEDHGSHGKDNNWVCPIICGSYQIAGYQKYQPGRIPMSVWLYHFILVGYTLP